VLNKNLFFKTHDMPLRKASSLRQGYDGLTQDRLFSCAALFFLIFPKSRFAAIPRTPVSPKALPGTQDERVESIDQLGTTNFLMQVIQKNLFKKDQRNGSSSLLAHSSPYYTNYKTPKVGLSTRVAGSLTNPRRDFKTLSSL
jgi:hypothetical protein